MNSIKNRLLKTLRYTEKYTKTDMVYLTKSSFWTNLNFVVSSALALLLSIGLANYLPKETYGTYQYILSLASIFTAFSLTGANFAVTQSVARGFESSFVESIKPQIKWGLLSSLLSLVGAFYYALNDSLVLAICLILIGISLPIVNTSNTYVAFFTGKKDFRKIFYYNNAFNLTYTILLFTTVILTQNIVYIIFVYSLLTSSINLILLLKSIKFSNQNSEVDQDLIPYSKHLSVMNIISTVVGKIDSVLVFHYLGAANLAIYSIAKLVPEKIGGSLKSFGTIAYPKFSTKEKHEIQSTIVSKTTMYIITALCFSLLYIIIAPVFFKLFFPKYTESILYSQIFSLSLITSAASLPTYAMISQKLKKGLYTLHIISPILQLGIMFIMLYSGGLWGLIYSKILSGALHVVLSSYLAHKHTQPDYLT